jgi:TolB-like protein/tetratricopeptide (TPR) repeat protein
VARRGYRFIATVTALPEVDLLAAPALSLPAPPAPAAVDEPRGLARGRRQSDKRRWLGLVLASSAATGLGGALWWTWRHQPAPASDAIALRATLAVLPFKPLAAESRDELLEVGMADSLITRLSTVQGLVVRSVGSVRRYAGAEQDPLHAARDLDVAWIVDGSLQRRGDQLRVSARLLRASDGAAAWSDSFDEKFTGVFDVQDLISTRVMQALAPRLAANAGVAAGARLTDIGGTRNTDAYQLYLSGSRQLQSRRANGARKAIELFNKALTFDPAYALAYVGLAEGYRETLLAADAVPAEVFESAKAAAQRALALAPSLAEALTERGFGLYYFEFDWPGAEREFRRALAINPNVAMAHFGLAQLLLTQDRPDEGFVHLRLARELDPMSPFINTLEASYLLARGQREESRVRLNRAFDIAPDFWLAHRTQGLLHLAEHQPELAIASLRRAATLADGNTRIQALLAMHLARMGQRDEARTIQKQLLDLARTRYVSPVSLAVVHAALGETPLALDALERALAARDTQLVFLKDDPRWSGLRKEPRFVALMHELKLDRYGPGLSPT